VRYRRIVALLAALGVGLAAAACGMPSRTDVVVDGEGITDLEQNGSGAEGPPPGPEGAGTVEEFVRRYLEAPAGDWDGAAARVRRFLSPQAQGSWQEPSQITVIRLIGGKPEIKPASTSKVVLNVQQIGVLTNRGTLDPPTTSATSYTFDVGPTGAPGGDLAVVNPPPGVMLLTDTALARWYDRRTIYFWDSGQHTLVPDLRYVPRTLEDAARPNLLIDWLVTDGPSAWLSSSVQKLPDGTKQLGRAYKDSNGRLVVNLNNAATSQNLDQLLAQLCLSLRADFSGDVVLQIESVKQREGTTSDFFDRDAAYRVSSRGEEQFAVAGGVVRWVDNGAAPPSPEAPLPAEVNKNVQYAAITDSFAAVVRHDQDRLRLWVGPNQAGRFIRTDLRTSAMSRPVLAERQKTGYVAAGGKLYQFTPDSAKSTEVNVAQLSAPVTSVALAPDGRRLAVVAGGQPYLVALSGDGGGEARPLPSPPLLGSVTAVSWVNETSLVMAGPNRAGVALVTVTLDGAVITAQHDEPGISKVTQVVAFPEDPRYGSGGRVMIEADNRTYEVYSSTVVELTPDRLVGQPTKGVVPTAPFFKE
jgi:hypothetical protein